MTHYYYKKNIFTFLLFFSLFFISSTAFASGLVPCGLGSNDPCTLCHLIVGIKSLIDWGMAILVTLSITAISIAGVIYVVSSGNSGLITKAKSFVTSVIIGFALMLGAWLIINVVLWLFSAKTDLGIQKENWYTFSCSTISSSTSVTTTGQGGVAAEPLATDFNCANFTFQTSSIKSQCNSGDASSELQVLMMCMQSKLGSKMTINSISDDAGLQNCISNYSKPPCAHAKSSCHYGGTAGGKSQAIDISTKTGISVNSILTAAKECGAGYSQNEPDTNHVHVSTTACKNN